MKGKEQFIMSLRAGYNFFYLESYEMNRAVDEISFALRNFTNGNGEPEYKLKIWDFETDQDPDKVMEYLDDLPSGTVVLAKNLNWFLKDEMGGLNYGLVSYLQNRTTIFSDPDIDKKLVIVSDDNFNDAIPSCLQRDFIEIEFGLPGTSEINKILDYIIDSAKESPKFKEPDKKTKEELVDAARGMTEREITNAYAYSIIKDEGIMNPLTVQEIRSKEIAKTPGLKIGKYNKTLKDLQGYDKAKSIVDDYIDEPDALGIILLGPAGVGKTHFAQSIGGHYGRLVIEVEFAQMMGDGLVGQAEKAWGRAIEVIRANANPSRPIIVFMDEIEKGLAGTSGAGAGSTSNDGGTGERSSAQLLKFMSDGRPEGVYIIATCNNIEQLPAAWVRAERWDCAPLMEDLPGDEQRKAILDYYVKMNKEVHGYKVEGKITNMEGWSGAEIKSACKMARIRKKRLDEIESDIIPVSKTMEREISYLRKWAEGKTIPATTKVKLAGRKVKKRKLAV